jgi:UDP-N-acetyl-2-amino-2-deoxyglucuronate dehydrogenase
MWGYRSQTYYDTHPWRGTWELDGGGSLVNQGVHYVDTLLWMLGDVDRVEYARSAVRNHKIETEDNTEAALTFKNGAWGTIITTTCFVPGVPANIYLAGDRGSAMISEHDLHAWSFKADVVDTKEFGKPPEREIVVADEVGAPKHWAEDVVSALTTGTKVVCSGSEGRRTVALSAAIFEAARTGKSVSV